MDIGEAALRRAAERDPPATSQRNTITLITISVWVIDQVRGSYGEVARANVAAGPRPCSRRTFVRSPAHSGQRIPTEVGVMQSGHIGRPQLEHETPVSRVGWR